MAPATEEDVVIILKNLMKEEAEKIGVDISTPTARDALRDDMVFTRKSRLRSEKREDVIRNALLGILVLAAAYALFQGLRYYVKNGIDSQVPAISAPAK